MSLRKYLPAIALSLLAACSAPDLTAPAVSSTDDALLAKASSGRFGVAIKYVLVGGANLDYYSFEASDETGQVVGQFRLYQVRVVKSDGTRAYATVDVRGKVQCMNVVGKKARLGGVVTSSDFSGIPVGTQMTWSVSDNASSLIYRPGAKAFDSASTLYGGVDPESYCRFGLAYPEQPLLIGDLVITE